MGLVKNWQGSWVIPGTSIHLPDFGATEGAANQMNSASTGQGGSDININKPTTGQAWSDPSLSSVYNQVGTPTNTPVGTPDEALARTISTGVNGGNKTTNTTKTTPQQQSPIDSSRAAFDSFINSGGYAGWDMGSAWADWSATNGSKAGGQNGGGQSEDQQISDLYGGQIDLLNQMGTDAGQRNKDLLAAVEPEYAGYNQDISNESADLEKAIGIQGERLSSGAQSGYSDAIRAYNALKQQGMNRYGGGSSTGGAVSELIGQEFLRTTGQARQQLAQGQQDLGLELQKVKTYIGQKKTDVNKWKTDAIAKINDQFSTTMDNINYNKMQTEQNKMMAKQEALKQVIADSRAVDAEDKKFKQGLATWALETMQGVSQKSFTPQEIAAVYNEVLGQTYSGLGNNQGGSYTQYGMPRVSKDSQDVLKQAGLV